jgi:hypothetical protein
MGNYWFFVLTLSIPAVELHAATTRLQKQTKMLEIKKEYTGRTF